MENLSTLNLILLGTPQVYCNGAAVTGFISDKARALLYYLAANDLTANDLTANDLTANNEVQQRSDLAALFWPAMPMDQALKNLRQALHNLQQLLSPHLLVTRQTVAFDHSYPLTVDLAEVRQLLAAGTQSALRAAITQATSELLAGFSLGGVPDFAAWLTEERAYLQQQLVDGVATLARHALRGGHWTEAIPLLGQWLQWQPWNEEVGQWLMVAKARSGDYNGALRAFATLQQQLRQELDVEPGNGTCTLRARILQARTRQRNGQFSVPVVGVGREVLQAEIRQHFAHHLRPSPQTAEHPPVHGAECECDGAAKAGGQLLSLTGLGGMGKTHLARAIAYEHRYTFFDGVWWVSLAPYTTINTALTAIAQALAVDLRTGGDLVTQITRVLSPLEALLILDNTEQLPQEALRHFVKTVLAAAPQVTILLTSWLPLGLSHEKVLPLAGFTDQAACVQLFRQSAARVSTLAETASEADAIARICRLVDGMPLAIQLAATLTDLYSCEAVAAQLSNDLSSLQTAQQDVPERQRSMRALLAATWAERTPNEQRALAKLTIFSGSFSHAAARQIVQLSKNEIDRLCDHALLHRNEKRLTIHELLRQYILEQQVQLLEPAAQAALHRHFQHYFLTLVAEQTPLFTTAQAATAIAVIADELRNVQQAWQSATMTQSTDLLAAAWQPLVTFYRCRGPFAEGAKLLQTTAETLLSHPPNREIDTHALQSTTALICSLQIAAADLYILAGNFTGAYQLACGSLALADADGCVWALVDALLKKSHALRALGRLAEAQAAVAQAAALIAPLPEYLSAAETTVARTRATLQLDLALEQGLLAIDLGNVTAATPALETALALAQEHGEEMRECLAACELGYVYMALAKYAEADVQLQRARHIAHQWADTRQESQVLARQARLYRECGDVERWRRSSEAALACCRHIGDLVGEARTLNELGIFYRQQGDYRQAQRAFLETLQLLRQTNDRPFETVVLQNLGALELTCGRHAEAEAHLRQACDLCDTLAGIDMQCVLRVYLSWHATEVGDGPRALAYAQAALALAEATARPAFLVFVQVTVGNAYLTLDDWAAAQHAFLLAQEHRSTISEEPLYSAISGQAYAAWQLGDQTTALALATTVIEAPWTAVVQQVDTPFSIYWRCYQILAAYADQRASTVLATIHSHFQEQLARIEDPLLQRSFAENVPAHRQLLAEIGQVNQINQTDTMNIGAIPLLYGK